MRGRNQINLLAITLFGLASVSMTSGAMAENIDATLHFAYGENVGWINFKSSQGSGVTVTDSAVTGFAYGENIGWVKLDPTNGGVLNDGSGNLSGYAWGENVGWINFAPTNGGVKINTSNGVFSGYAWGENVGWINFAPTNGGVTTSWRPGAPPDTIIDSAPSGTVNTSSATISFHSTVANSTFQCQLDLTAPVSCISPKSYTGLSDVPHTFTVTATDPDNRTDPTPATVSWTVDTTPPDTLIDTGPSGTVASTSASFTFHSTEANSTFACKLDGSPVTCTTAASLSGLAQGSHTFEVAATDAVGNTDQTPVSRMWIVDTIPPDTLIDSGPSGTVGSTSASYTFHSTEANSTFACKLDGSPVACTTSASLSGLSQGTHTFQVTATDAVGNTDQTPVSRMWTVDSVPPDTVIDSGPTGIVATNAASFTFHSTEANSAFKCTLDTGSPASCTSPVSYSGLGLGSHTFQVAATDPVGNADNTPASRSWQIHGNTSLLYNGAQIVTSGSALSLGALLSSTASPCVASESIGFALDANPLTGAQLLYNLGSATTNTSGQANSSVLTTSWLEGVYTLTSSFAATTSCNASQDTAALTVASPGSAATGGGWYTLSGSGRTNFGFTVHLVPNTTNTYKGQILVINNGKWRLKGTLDTYAKTGKNGAASGTGTLYYWNATLNGGLGDWALSQNNVTYTISFADNSTGGQTDTFGIHINHPLTSPAEPNSLPNSSPVVLKGGNIQMK